MDPNEYYHGLIARIGILVGSVTLGMKLWGETTVLSGLGSAVLFGLVTYLSLGLAYVAFCWIASQPPGTFGGAREREPSDISETEEPGGPEDESSRDEPSQGESSRGESAQNESTQGEEGQSEEPPVTEKSEA